ncbi:MAG TPA: glyoxalase superfamily protein [Planctomycetota bacterium]|nr:glyoxalase superfamily protein [Planctomycetota bacterium]
MNYAKPSIGLIKIPVTDLARAVVFYRDVIGMEVEDLAEEYGWAHLLAGTIGLGLYVPGHGAGDRKPGGTVDFQIEVDDVRRLFDRLRSRRALIPEGVFQSDDGTYCMELIDPDGNILTITQRPAGA